MKSTLPYFKSSFIFTLVALVLGGWIGYFYSGTVAGVLHALFICAMLGVLETSLSFDNAVVNATVLKKMTPLWQHRFMTWGMLIAVFGMRLVFPLVIVSVASSINPWQAIVMAATDPESYARIMLAAHHQVSAFGGAFLMLVAFKYFFDTHKEVHWLSWIEKPLAKLGHLEAIEVGLVLLILYQIGTYVPETERLSFLYAGIAGILVYLAVEAIGVFLTLSSSGKVTHDIHRASIGMFLYLEVLDASFSFDGVVGAFAVSNNLFLIALGLGIGAMFVRSLTIMMVEKETLEAFRFLEHGAFYAIGALAALMFLNVVIPVHEAVTGLVGAAIIGFSVLASIRKPC